MRSPFSRNMLIRRCLSKIIRVTLHEFSHFDCNELQRHALAILLAWIWFSRENFNVRNWFSSESPKRPVDWHALTSITFSRQFKFITNFLEKTMPIVQCFSWWRIVGFSSSGGHWTTRSRNFLKIGRVRRFSTFIVNSLFLCLTTRCFYSFVAIVCTASPPPQRLLNYWLPVTSDKQPGWSFINF